MKKFIFKSRDYSENDTLLNEADIEARDKVLKLTTDFLNKYPHAEIMYSAFPEILKNYKEFNPDIFDNFLLFIKAVSDVKLKNGEMDALIEFYRNNKDSDYEGIWIINTIVKTLITVHKDCIFNHYVGSDLFKDINTTLININMPYDMIASLNKIGIYSKTKLLMDLPYLENQFNDITDRHLAAGITNRIVEFLKSSDNSLLMCSTTGIGGITPCEIYIDLVCPRCGHVNKVFFNMLIDDNGCPYFEDHKIPSNKTEIVCDKCGNHFRNRRFTKFIYRSE